jgi:hypothetical protein
MAKKNNNNTEEPLEKQLWKTADKLRKTSMLPNTSMWFWV